MISRFGVILCAPLMCLSTSAAPPNVEGARIQISAYSPTPVLEVVENLISNHRWEIQFEDWGEVKDEPLKVRIPSDADQRSEVMPIAIPNSCRSPFQSDGDHHSKLMPITFRQG